MWFILLGHKESQGRNARQEFRDNHHRDGLERCPVVNNKHCSCKDRFSFQHCSVAYHHLEHQLQRI